MKKYYLEVMGGTNPNQLYVVNANHLYIGERYYEFMVNGVGVAYYPINCTVIKSIEEVKKD